MLKNAPACAEASAGRQMQVELCEIRFTGAPEILRVALRRIRSDFLPRRRDGEAAGERGRWAFLSILLRTRRQ
jgi:hypothetical protein